MTDPSRPESEASAPRWPTAILGSGCLLFALVGATLVAIPNLLEARKQAGEAPAIGALKTVHTSQELFRAGDDDQDGVDDYAGSLRELSDAGLIDAVLGAGAKQGYRFQLGAAGVGSSAVWMATADPVDPAHQRHYAIDPDGVIFYALDRPFRLEPGQAIPAWGREVGR